MRKISRFLWYLGMVFLAITTLGAGDSLPIALPVARDLAGKALSLEAPQGGASLIVFYSSECPISNAYSPILNEIAGAFPREKLTIVGVCVDPDLSDGEIAQHAQEYKLLYPVMHDPKASLSTKLGMKVTPEVAILDHENRVRYRGRIDDQFVAKGKRNPNNRTHEARDAIEAVLAGREPAVAYVEAVGCPIPTPRTSKSAAPLR